MSEEPLEHWPVIVDAPPQRQATILLKIVKKRLRASRNRQAAFMRTGLTYPSNDCAFIQAMSSESLHESAKALRPETIDRHRAVSSLMEELEAVDWYDQAIRN